MVWYRGNEYGCAIQFRHHMSFRCFEAEIFLKLLHFLKEHLGKKIHMGSLYHKDNQKSVTTRTIKSLLYVSYQPNVAAEIN